MIEFKHKLPAMHVDGKQNGTYNNIELGFPAVSLFSNPSLLRKY